MMGEHVDPIEVAAKRIAELEENARLTAERVHQLHEMYDKARGLLRLAYHTVYDDGIASQIKGF